jgi:hypothetical protein
MVAKSPAESLTAPVRDPVGLRSFREGDPRHAHGLGKTSRPEMLHLFEGELRSLPLPYYRFGHQDLPGPGSVGGPGCEIDHCSEYVSIPPYHRA